MSASTRHRHPLQKIQNRFLRDTATLQIAGVMSQSSQVFSTLAIAYLLGSVGQGLFVSALALQALTFFLVNVGVAQAAVSSISSASARGLDDKVTAWISFTAKAVLTLGVVVIALGWLMLPWAGETFFQNEDVGRWAWWLCFGALIEAPRTVVGLSFQGTRRMLLLGKLENATELVRMFLVVLGALITGGPEGAVLGTLAASVFGSAISLELYRHARSDGRGALPSMSEILRGMPGASLRRGLRLSLRVVIMKNGHVLFINIFPRLILGSAVGVSWAAYFHIAQRLMSLPLMLMMGVSRTALPALGELAGRQDREGFRRAWVRITSTAGLLVAGVMMVLVVAVPWIVAKVFPQDYAGPVAILSRILLIGYLAQAFAVAVESFYIAANKVKQAMTLTILGCLTTIPINVVLIKGIPVTGAVWGVSVYQSWAAVHVIYIFWFLHKGDLSTLWTGPTLEQED